METYNIGDRVVVRNYESNEIAVITEIHYLKKAISGYTVRSEKGAEYAFLGVDNDKSSQTIISGYTTLLDSKHVDTSLTVSTLGNFK